MGKGVDGTADCSLIAKQLIAAGYTFVGRYYSHSGWKNLSKAEALALSHAGLYIVSVWETNPTTPGYFTRQRGFADAGAARAYATNVIGQPANTPIYFAVDTDADPAIVEPYFRGIQEANSMPHSPYPVGAYGGGAVLDHLLNQGLIQYAWLANATGWQGSNTFTRWNIKQLPEFAFEGHDFDGDLTNGNGGGWKL